MKLKTAADVLAVARARGFTIYVKPGPPPMPMLHRPASVPEAYVTDALLGALRAWRVEIMELIAKET